MSANNDSAAQLVHQGEQTRQQGDLNEAFNLFNQALKLYWDIEDSQKEQISCIYCLADILRDCGKAKSAKVFYDLAKSLEDFGPDHIETLKARNEFAHFYLDIRNLPTYLDLEERLVADSLRVLGADNLNTITYCSNLAIAYISFNRAQEAVSLLEQVVATSTKIQGADHKDTVFFRTNLVTAYEAVERYEEAEALRKQGIIENDSDIADDDPVRISILVQLAEKFMSNKDFDYAISAYETAISESTRILGAEHKTTFVTRYNLAITYAEIGKINECIALLKQLIADMKQTLEPDDPIFDRFYKNICALYENFGGGEEAAALLEQLKRS